MQKILAIILSVIMAINSFIPALIGKELITVDDFLAQTYVEFGMPDDMGLVSTEDIAKGGTYLNYAVCYSVLFDVSSGCFSETAKFGWAKIGKIDALKALADAKEAWANKTFGEPVAEQITPEEVNFSGDFEPALVQSEFIDGNGNVLQSTPQANKTSGAQKNLDIEGLLQKLDVDFSIGNFDFGLKVLENGFNLDIATVVTEGVRIQKSYNVSDLSISTKFDGNLVTKDIREAYFRCDYSVSDITTLSGSYAASVAADLPEGATPVDFMTAAKNGLLTLVSGGNNKLTVFTLNVPIPNLPTVTVSLDINIRISIEGQMQITLESQNITGIEIINNKIRLINEVTYGSQTYDISANIRFTVGLCFSVKALGYTLLDVEIEAGLGARCTVYVKAETAVYILEMPFSLCMEIPYPTGGMDGAEFCGNIKLYGVLEISIGKNSQIMKIAGLQKSWSIFNEGNAVIYNFHIEENGIVDSCTRART